MIKILNFDIENKKITLNNKFVEFLYNYNKINFITIIDLNSENLKELVYKLTNININLENNESEIILIDLNLNLKNINSINNFLLIYNNYGKNKWCDKIGFSLLYIISSLIIFNTKNKIIDEELLKLNSILKIKKFFNFDKFFYFNFKINIIWNIFKFDDIFDKDLNLITSNNYLNFVLNKNSFELNINNIKNEFKKIFDEKICFGFNKRNFDRNIKNIKNIIFNLNLKTYYSIEFNNNMIIGLLEYLVYDINNSNKIYFVELYNKLIDLDINFKFENTILDYDMKLKKIKNTLKPMHLDNFLKILKNLREDCLINYKFKYKHYLIKNKINDLLKYFKEKEDIIFKEFEKINDNYNKKLFENVLKDIKHLDNKNKNKFDIITKNYRECLKIYKQNLNENLIFINNKLINFEITKYIKDIKVKNNDIKKDFLNNQNNEEKLLKEYNLKFKEKQGIIVDKENKLKRLNKQIEDLNTKKINIQNNKKEKVNNIKLLNDKINNQKLEMSNIINSIRSLEEKKINSKKNL